MQGNTRRTIIFSLFGVLALALGVWWYSGFSLGFMKFFAASPADTATTVTPTTSATPIVTPVPTSVTCAPATQTVAPGASAALTVSGAAAPFAWFAPEGNPPTGTGTAFSVSYPSVGTKKVTVQGAGNDGSINSSVCTVIVQ